MAHGAGVYPRIAGPAVDGPEAAHRRASGAPPRAKRGVSSACPPPEDRCPACPTHAHPADRPRPGDDYVAGACNIGPWEIRRRRLSAIAAFVGCGPLFVVLVAVGAPAWTRLILILPLWGGAVSWLQARRRFCVAYAMGGLANFGDGEATRRSVVDPVQRAADRRATVVLVRDAFLLALVPTVVALILPF